MGSPEIGLWKDVLESKYGPRRLTNSPEPKRNRNTSRWWNDLSKVSLLDQGDNWFNSIWSGKLDLGRRSNFGKMNG